MGLYPEFARFFGSKAAFQDIQLIDNLLTLSSCRCENAEFRRR
jgi:hypothetical protein